MSTITLNEARRFAANEAIPGFAVTPNLLERLASARTDLERGKITAERRRVLDDARDGKDSYKAFLRQLRDISPPLDDDEGEDDGGGGASYSSFVEGLRPAGPADEDDEDE